VQTKSSPKPEESQKDSNFNRKTIPYPGFEPGTSGLAVGSHNHCIIWVSCPAGLKKTYFQKLKKKNKKKLGFQKNRTHDLLFQSSSCYRSANQSF
jgi:hypothetical protein